LAARRKKGGKDPHVRKGFLPLSGSAAPDAKEKEKKERVNHSMVADEEGKRERRIRGKKG